MRLVVILLVALTATASADQKSAEHLFRAGEKAYKGQKFLIAAQNFEQAYKELAAPEIAFSAAQAYRRQYRLDPTHPEYVQAAVRYYQIYIKEQKGGTRLGDAADALGEMLHEVDRLGLKTVTDADKPKQPMIGVSVLFTDREKAASTSQPMTMHEVDDKAMESADADKTDPSLPTAHAFLDGKPVELYALQVVDEKEHVLRAEAPGYKPAERTVRAVVGFPQNIELVLEPLPAQVTVKTEPGALLIVDGQGRGKVPNGPISLAGGSHVLTIVRTGRRPVAQEVVVTRDQKLELPIALEPTKRRRAVPWVLGAGGVAVLATGVFVLGANHYDNKAVDELALLDMGDMPRSVLDDYERYKKRRDVALDLAYISAGTAAAIGITAAWMYYFDTPSSEGLRVTPFTSSTTGGAAISGRF